MRRHWHWGTRIALVYGMFVAGTITMVVIAMNQRVDLVAPDYYARALRQDDRMAAQHNANALGTTFTAVVVGQSLEVTWPHVPDAGTITMYRPSNAGADRDLVVTPLPLPQGSRQAVPLEGLSPGAWRAQVSWSLQGRPYYAEREVVVR